MFTFVAGLVREKRRTQGHDELKLMFTDVKAHLNAKCDEDEWVELPDEFEKFGRHAKLKRWLYGMRMAASGLPENWWTTGFDKAEQIRRHSTRRCACWCLLVPVGACWCFFFLKRMRTEKRTSTKREQNRSRIPRLTEDGVHGWSFTIDSGGHGTIQERATKRPGSCATKQPLAPAEPGTHLPPKRGAPRALAAARLLKNTLVSADQRPPTSTPKTTNRHGHARQ